MSPLEGIRAEVERLDRELVSLIVERFQAARQVAAIKRREGLPVLDPAQEAAVLRRAAEWARAAGLPAEGVREVFWSLIALTRRAQHDAPAGPR